MANTVNLNTPTDYNAQLADIERRRKYAEMLQQQGMQPVEQQTAGGYVVPTSWTQGLAKALQAGLGGYQQGQLREEQKALGEDYRARNKAQGAEFIKLLHGTPAQSDNDPFGPTEMPAVAGDRQKALGFAMDSENPTLKSASGAMLAQMLKPKELKPGKPGDVLFDSATGAIGETLPGPRFRPEPTKPTKMPTPGDMRQRINGESLVEEEYQPDGTWRQTGTGPRFARQVPPVVVGGGGAKSGVKAPVGYRFSSDGETLEAIPGGPKDQSNAKPLPTAALKLEQAERDAIGTSASISADLGAIDKLIDDKKLDLGLVSNIVAQGRNTLGYSDPKSVAFNTFKTTLEQLRNNSLRLNKGVQTEGDSVRAWNELMGSLNDNTVVKDRLKAIREINDRAINLRKLNIDAIRANYGQQPADVSGYTNQPAAVGGDAPAVPTATGPNGQKLYLRNGQWVPQ